MKRVTEDEKRWIVELAYEGRGVAYIARETGRSEGLVRRVLAPIGLP